MSLQIAVIGAGIVGITAALELQSRGCRVSLFDRDAPGQHTSRWNAGVLTPSSLVPLNNPQLIRLLPELFAHRAAGFRLNYPRLLSLLSWGMRFLSTSRGDYFNHTVAALHSLIGLSIQAHRELLMRAACTELLRDTGWLMLYETDSNLRRACSLLSVLQQYEVKYELLDTTGIMALEPMLGDHFAHAIWVRDALSVTEPAAVVDAYFNLYRAAGGNFVQREISSIQQSGLRWCLLSRDAELQTFDHLVVACGAWSPAVLRPLGIVLPMAVERGYLQRYSWSTQIAIQRPLYDVTGGLVLSPRPEGVQLSTGVELTTLEAPAQPAQLRAAEQRARALFSLGPPLSPDYQLGNRPTLPDSRPAIGPINRLPGLWLACGHQHIGFTTAPGSARLLAGLILGEPPPIDARAFSPARFKL